MSYKVQTIKNLRTVKALRGQSLTIDLGKTFTGTMTAWMKKKATDVTYRSFDIVDNRFLFLTKEKTQDYHDINSPHALVEAIAGKWYFDVRIEPVGNTNPDLQETLITGTLLFSNHITDSSGIELVNNIPTATPDQFLYLSDTPSQWGEPGQFLRINAAGDGLEFFNESDISITTTQISNFEEIVQDKNFIFDQGMPSSVWTIQHNLNKFPSACAVDTAKSMVVGQIDYIDLNNLTITFNASFSGEAYLN
jgi:hypothetical protein